MELQDKVRRRLAPFMAEGEIDAPDFSTDGQARLQVMVRRKAHGESRLEERLGQALSDLGGEVELQFRAGPAH